MPSGRPDVDVAIGGDGPAGSALAAACAAAGLEVALVGDDRPWGATYGTWCDDVADLPDTVYARRCPAVVVWGDRRHDLDRAYGVIDNGRLRVHLREGVAHHRGWVTGVQHFEWGSRLLSGAGDVDARLVVDAAGWPPLIATASAAHRRPAWQTAYGVVLPVLPAGRVDAPSLMDLRPPAADAGADGDAEDPPSFAYVVPVADGWLVEETVLAARPSVDPERLRVRLRARIGPWAHGTPVEQVRIPMGAPVPRAVPAVIPFGAAAGYVHPATGYSLAPSLRAAPRVAEGIAGAIANGRTGSDLMAATWGSVWPASLRHTRRLHRIGLTALLALDGPGLRAFFDAFFDLPVERWRDYLRIDSSPGDVARAMQAVFAAAPGPVRARLAGAIPRAGLAAVAHR